MIAIISLLLIIGLLVVFLNVTPRKRRSYSYSKSIQWLFAIYIAMLVIAVPVSLMLPDNSSLPDKKDDMPENMPSLFSMAKEGKIERSGQIFQEKTWEMTAENKDIQLKMGGSQNVRFHPPVFVERVADQGETIKAAYYRTPLIVGGKDLSGQMMSPDVSHSPGAIGINVRRRDRINLSMFRQEFPISQFTDQGSRNWMEDAYTGGEQLLYIKMPEDIQLNYHDHISLHYAGDNQQ